MFCRDFFINCLFNGWCAVSERITKYGALPRSLTRFANGAFVFSTSNNNVPSFADLKMVHELYIDRYLFLLLESRYAMPNGISKFHRGISYCAYTYAHALWYYIKQRLSRFSYMARGKRKRRNKRIIIRIDYPMRLYRRYYLGKAYKSSAKNLKKSLVRRVFRFFFFSCLVKNGLMCYFSSKDVLRRNRYKRYRRYRYIGNRRKGKMRHNR